LNTINREKNMGIISQADSSIELAKITKAVLEMVNQMD